jgi:hypothetical protein
MDHAATSLDRPLRPSPRPRRSPPPVSGHAARGRVGRRRGPHRQSPIARPAPAMPTDLLIALLA